MTFDTTTLSKHPQTLTDASWVHWALRLSIAGTFIYHGLLKFENLAAGAEQFGVPYGLWIIVSVLEVVAPLLLITGGFFNTKIGDLLTRSGAAIGAGILIGAIALVHWGRWSFAPGEGYPIGGMEFQVALLTMHIYFLVRGNNA